MTQKELKTYIKDQELSGTLLLLYNGWRYINNRPTITSINAMLALADKAFCKYIIANSMEDYD